MQKPLLRLHLYHFHTWRFSKHSIYQSSSRLAKSATAVESQDRVKISNDSSFKPSLTQAHRLTSTIDASSMSSTLETSPDHTLLKPLVDQTTLRSDELQLRSDSGFAEQSPLPFEEVPGPALLKFWEKYWKYVPLFGTQLLRSALINGLTEGQLFWNRNVTPMKYLFNEYGPIVRINGPLTGDIVLIHRPEHIAKIFEAEGNIPTRSAIDVLQHYRLNYKKYRFAGPFCAQGSEGMEWLQIKKELEVPIMEQINKQFGKLEITCNELILRIREIRNRQDEVPKNFNDELSRWGMECFWISMLNKKMGFLNSTSYNENSESTRFIEELNEAHLYLSRCETGFQVWRFFDTPFIKKLFSSCNFIDGVIGKYIRMAQNSDLEQSMSLRNSNEDQQTHSTVLTNLLNKQHVNPDDVSTILMDMIILGVQATVNTQAFLLYYLAKNPRVQRTLYDEVVSEFKKNPILSKKTIDNMSYLSACIKECLRLRPPFPYLTRLLSNDMILHGYKIPKGTYVIMANQISSQREENFEDPEKFKPERWLKAQNDVCQQNSSLPFGKGLRSCIGENMAKLQIMLLTSKIIQEFKVEYDYADIKSRYLMINVPNKPLRFRFVERN